MVIPARKFELFTGRHRPVNPDIPRVSLNRRSNFYLNHAAYVALGSPEAVVLMYDSAAKLIGLKPADKSVRHAYPVRKQENSYSYLVGGIAFANHYGLPLKNALSFSPVVEDGVMVLDLNQAITVTRNRSSKSS